MTTTQAYDVLAMGRSSIDLYSNDVGAPFVDIKSFAAYVGGCPLNISVGTRRLGLRSALLTAFGEDVVGDFILHFLQQEGVEAAFIPRKAGRRTSAVVGERSMRARIAPRVFSRVKACNVPPKLVATRRVETQRIGGKSFTTSHQMCGASAARNTNAVTHGARERK